MDKKEIGKKILTTVEQGTCFAVGVGTGLVTTTICMAFMPQEAPRAAAMAFRVGTYGLSGVTGSCAATLAHDEIDEAKVKGRRLLNKYKKNRVKMEVVEE